MTPASLIEVDYPLEQYHDKTVICMQVAQEWGFPMGDLNRLFGFEATVTGSPVRLAQLLKNVRSYDVNARCDLILKIKDKLEAIFGSNATKQKRWLMSNINVEIGTKRPHEMMTYEDFAGLNAVLNLLVKITG